MSIFDKSYWLGSKERTKQLGRYTPDQESALNELLAQGRKYSDISGQEALARKRFNEETIPSIWERYGKFGGSSALQAQLGRASSDLEAQLAAIREQYGLKAEQMGLTPRYDTYIQPAQHGFLDYLPPALLDVGKAWATMGLSSLGGKNTPPPGSKEPSKMMQGIRPGEPGYGETPEDVRGYADYMSNVNPIQQENPVFNQLYDIKRAASPTRSRYTNLFGNSPEKREPYNAMMDNPVLASLLSRYQPGAMPGIRRPSPMKSTGNFLSSMYGY